MGSTQLLTEMSTRNITWGGKGSRCVGQTNLRPFCADCLEILEPRRAGTLRACPGLYGACFTVIERYIRMCVYCMHSGSRCNHCVRGLATGLVSFRQFRRVRHNRTTTVIRTGGCGVRDLKYCNVSYPRRLWTSSATLFNVLSHRVCCCRYLRAAGKRKITFSQILKTFCDSSNSVHINLK